MKYGSDYARAWARRLSFRTNPDDPGDVRMKSVLMAICNYVDEDGHSWPSIGTLAEDTDQSYDSVRRRLRDLATCGTIARFPRFVDDNGKINTEGRGRRTSDELRLIFDTTRDQVAERMQTVKSHRTEKRGRPSDDGDHDNGQDTPSDPCPQQGSDGGVTNPATGPQQGSDPSPQQGGIWPPGQSNEPSLEQKEDSPPYPPPGGETKQSDDFEKKKAASWVCFEAAWQEPILRQSIAKQVWWALTDAEESLATKAAQGYVIHRRAQKKPPNVIGAHLFLRERDAWEKFAAIAPPEPKPVRYLTRGSEEWRALQVMRTIASLAPLTGDAKLVGAGPAGAAALAPYAAEDGTVETSMWTAIPERDESQSRDDKRCIAWRERVHEWLGLHPRAVRQWLGEAGEVVSGPALAKKRRVNGYEIACSRDVLLVPCEWPPAKHGEAKPTTDPPVKP